MKHYQKPAMLALSLSANDMLCSGCGTKTKSNTVLSNILDELCKTDATDNFFSKKEADSVNAFAPSEESCTGIKITYNNYCKFTSAGTLQLFNS